MNTSLFPLLTSHWWLLLVRGLLAVLFGVLALVWPRITLVTLVFLFATYALFDGLLALISLGRVGSTVHRWWLLLVGISGVGVATLTCLYPLISAWLLLMFMGVWAVVRGVGEIIGALHVRKKMPGEKLLILNGAASIGFGVFVLIRPREGALAALWLIGLYAIVAGLLLSGFAFRLRRLGQILQSRSPFFRGGTQAGIY